MRYEFAMMKVIRSSGCGNSPKQKLVEDMSVALAGADVGIMASLAVPELVWLHITAFCHMFEFKNAKGTHVKSISTYSMVLR